MQETVTSGLNTELDTIKPVISKNYSTGTNIGTFKIKLEIIIGI